MTWAAEPSLPALHVLDADEVAEILARVRALSNGAGAHGAASADTTTSATNVTLAGGASVAKTLTKVQGAGVTDVLIHWHISAYSTGALTAVTFAVDIDGVDYDLGSYLFNAASDHRQISGVARIPGIAAGARVLTLQWRRSAGAGTLTRGTDDALSWDVTEAG